MDGEVNVENGASERVIRSYFGIAGLYNLAASIIWGVNTLFLLDAGLSISQVFLANAAFTIGNVLFEIPTGVVADTYGRRLSFLLSTVVLGITTLAYVGASHFNLGVVEFCIISVFIGLGFTFYSGAVEAWLVDALGQTGFKGSLDQVFARGGMVSSGATLVGTTSGGLLGQLDLSIPFLVRSAALGVLFILAYKTMKDLGFKKRSIKLADTGRELRVIAKNSITYGWKQPTIRLLMLASAVQFGFMIWGFYAWQPYFLQLLESNDIWIAGVVAALVSLAMILGNIFVDRVTRMCGSRSTLLLGAAALQTLGAVGVGLADNFYLALASLLVTASTFGIIMPVRQAFIHSLIPSEQRATVVSFDSMVGNLGGTGGQASLGYLAQQKSYSAGYIVGGLCTVLAIPLLVLVKKRNDGADNKDI